MAKGYIRKKIVYTIFTLALIANVASWYSAKDLRSVWRNVPDSPGYNGIVNLTLGDPQFAYRAAGFFLQNIGDSGGRVVSLHDYDFDRLLDWFYLMDSLDPVSDYIGRLAAYYFGGSRDNNDARKVLSFLEDIGSRKSGEKWMLLAYAMNISWHQLNDMDMAMYYANILARLDNPDMPEWTRRAPSILLNAGGDRAAAYDIMMNILRTEADNINKDEIVYIARYICEDLLTEEEAKMNPICKGI